MNTDSVVRLPSTCTVMYGSCCLQICRLRLQCRLWLTQDTSSCSKNKSSICDPNFGWLKVSRMKYALYPPTCTSLNVHSVLIEVVQSSTQLWSKSQTPQQCEHNLDWDCCCAALAVLCVIILFLMGTRLFIIIIIEVSWSNNNNLIGRTKSEILSFKLEEERKQNIYSVDNNIYNNIKEERLKGVKRDYH